LATTIYRNGLRCYLHKMTQIFAHLSLSFLLVYLVTYCFLQAKKYGSLQVVSQYYQLQCPARGSSLTFHPLDHLHPLRFHRPGETVLHIAGSTIDLRSCDTSLEVAEVRYTDVLQYYAFIIVHSGVISYLLCIYMNTMSKLCPLLFRCAMRYLPRRNRLLYQHGLWHPFVDASGWSM
jgi:hypothetical protein